ncbi:MAG: imidazolonepropionase, partial [Candidatus Thermoplasmatota archaeon]|nr:imidazolonepropionase [Candidatus Thermoplasmatota archaeon]
VKMVWVAQEYNKNGAKGVMMLANKDSTKLDIAIINLAQLLRVAKGHRYKIGDQLDELFIIENGAIGITGKEIVFTGKTGDLNEKCNIGPKTRIIDGNGRIALPGFVDPHTHLIFSGTREHELDLKLQGKSYLDILKSGGGILYTVNRTRSASVQELVEETEEKLDRMLLNGTTTVEAKSGYGLERETELRSLRVIRTLNETHPIDIVPTFLGAHAIPPEYKGDSNGYIDYLIRDVLPDVVNEKLAVYCDVFLEKGVFGLEESRRLLKRAKEMGLGVKLHIDEIENLGGAGLAMELGAISVEHLVMTGKDEIKKLGASNICCIFLPGTPYSLMDYHYPDSKKFIAADAVVALATDLNPNCMTENMQNIISLACFNMRMTPAAAISASTINAAYGINREKTVGSIEVGKKADVIILDVDDYRKIPYHFGVNHVLHVIKKGKTVVFNGRLVRKERTVWVFGFRKDKVMMVKNVKRGGWEMPGGHAHKGEGSREAAKREFLEETGHLLEIISAMDAEHGKVFYGVVGEKISGFNSDEISDVMLWDQLPDDLNFPEIEYKIYMKAAPDRIRPSWV